VPRALFPGGEVPLLLPAAPRQHMAPSALPAVSLGLTAASDRRHQSTRWLPSTSLHSPAEIIPLHLVKFPHQQPCCSLIKAKSLIAVEAFAYQRISLRPHQMKHFSVPAPPLPAAQLSLDAQGEWVSPGFKVPLRYLCGMLQHPGKHPGVSAH